MRSDMGRIAVDAYRTGGWREKRRDPQRLTLEELPLRGRMAHRRRHPGENLNPLYRWLAKQVGRPWNKVYSEIVQTLHGGYANLEHIKSHVLGRVERGEVRIIDGWPHSQSWYWRQFGNDNWQALNRDQLYVNTAGILCCPPRNRPEPNEKRKAERARRPAVVMLDALTAASKIKGQWFAAELVDIPAYRVKDPWGVIWRRDPVTDALIARLQDRRLLPREPKLPYDTSKLYAPKIRPMGTREVAQRVPECYR